MDNEILAHPKLSRIIGIVLLFGFVFIMSIWLGRWLGNTTRRSIQAAFLATSRVADAPSNELKHAKRRLIQPKVVMEADNIAGESAGDRQRNILLIGIDSFQAKTPRLEGVWMVLYLRDLPHFMLVPVFPNRLQGGVGSTLIDQNLAELFTFEEGQVPVGSLFFQALHDKQLQWDGYMIFDRSALSAISTLITTGNEATDHDQLLSISNLSDVEEAPTRALLEQAHLAQQLCLSSSMVLTSESSIITDLIALAASHTKTDLDLGEIAGEVKSALRYGGGISCEFPSLETAANLP
jgi:hypothetical protein